MAGSGHQFWRKMVVKIISSIDPGYTSHLHMFCAGADANTCRWKLIVIDWEWLKTLDLEEKHRVREDRLAPRKFKVQCFEEYGMNRSYISH